MTTLPTVARDIMVTRLVTLAPEMDVFEAIDLLLKHQISGAPVVDAAGNFVGLFSEQRAISLLVAAAYDRAPTSSIGPFVLTDVATISPQTDLLTIAERFLNHNQRRLPVLDDEGRLVGQVSRRDVLRAARQLLEQPLPSESAVLYLSGVTDIRHVAIV
jgi:CBS domain-containing protein